MTPDFKRRLLSYALPMLGAFFTAARQDLAGFKAQKAKDDSLKFDWVVAFSKWLEAAFWGGLAGIGIDTTTGGVQ